MQKEICKEKSQETSRFPPYDRLINNRTDGIQHLSRHIRNKRESIANVNFLTTNTVKVISNLEMDYFFGEGLFQFGATPTELIESIYPLVRDDIDIFLHTAVFNEETEPIHFLNWMLNLYEEIHEDAQWEIYRGTDGKNHIQRVYDYSNEETGNSVGLQFAPKLKRENKELYELLMGTLMLLKQNNGVPFWWDDDDFEYAIDMLETEIEDFKSDLKSLKESKEDQEENIKCVKDNLKWSKRALKDYKNGVVAETKEDIINGKFDFTVYDNLTDNTSIEKKCKKFIDNAIKFMERFPDDNLNHYIHFHNHELDEGMPIGPDKYCCVGWSYDDDDPISSNMNMITQGNWQEYGSIPFRYAEFDTQETEISLMPFYWIGLLGDLQEIANEYC